MRKAMGLMQGPDNPPVTVESKGFRDSTSMAIPKNVLTSETASAPSASTALAISAISVTLGDSFTMSVLGYILRTACVTRAAEAADVPKAIPPSLTTSRYRVNGINYTTEVFASYPDQVIIVRIFGDKTGVVNFSATMTRPSKSNITTKGNDELVLSGITSDHETVKGAVQFATHIKILTHGGSTSTSESSLHVFDADTATIYISIASNFVNYSDISGNAFERASAYLQHALKKDYKQIIDDHIKDYRQYFKRVNLNLGTTDAIKNPIDVRLQQFSGGNDPQMVALYFQFGRYLLISSSRPGGQPANLQGIWNDELFPPWDSKYTVNINTEMNYWPSEVTNLSEMNEPLVTMVKELSQTGQKTAKDMYGMRGWVLHHNTDIWRINGPVDGAFWGMWPMGGAWLCQHLFDKYEYNGNKDYLESVYSAMKEASLFFLDFLTEEPEHKWLVVCPSVSPENSPTVHPEFSISAGTTMDNQLVFDLFTKTIKAAEILGKDKGLVKKMKNALKRLPPMQIGQWGQLQEWMHDWDNPNDHHRHVSHLYGLYPSNQISLYRTPELFSAAQTSLIARGDESTGWSMGWKVCLWARLLDGNHAYKLISDQLTPALQPDGKERGGTYPNLFDAHPPFQIDGNFGCTTGIAEMLLQSHDGAIHFLPALPDDWDKGEVSGLRTRGGFEVSFNWENGMIQKIEIKSKLGGNCRIRVPNEVIMVNRKGLKSAFGINPNPFFETPKIKAPLVSSSANLSFITPPPTHLYDFPTNVGEVYTLIMKE
jgi:alpha-L-fucosidase 2